VPVERRSGIAGRAEEPIYYEVAGSGLPVVLCHGAGGNHAIWFRQVVAFSERYQVVTWDHRGFGRSTATDAGDAKAAAADLEAVLDEIGIDRAHVVAQSMGGWGALGFTIANPGRVVSLTLCDTIAGITTPVVEQNWTDYLTRLRARPPSNALGESPAIGRRFVRDDPEGAALYQAIGSLNADLSPEILSGLLGTNWSAEELEGVSCPTLFVVGEDDSIFPPDVIRDCATTIIGAQVEVIAGAGHSPYFERPDAWNDVVGKFLAANPG
jgi:3-oxoadipate enol-lactonase